MAVLITPEYLAKNGTESGEQQAIFCWANMAKRYGFAVANDMQSYGQPQDHLTSYKKMGIPELAWMYAIPNGGGRTSSQASRLKAEGVKSGVSDICWPLRTKHWPGLYLELKREDGVPSDVSDAQKTFLAFVKAQGYWCAVEYGWRDAVSQIQSYFGDK